MKTKRIAKWQRAAFAGYTNYRYGKVPVRKKPARIFSGAKREHILKRLTEIMTNWSSSPFQHEGACRAGIRSDLCLAGFGWEKADTEAAALVGEALERLRARRPTWEQGQREYVVPRENCAWCYMEIPDELLIGSYHTGYCSPEHARLAILHRDIRSVGESEAAYFAAADVIKRGRQTSRRCENCGKKFRPTQSDGRFCSHECASEGAITLEPISCGQCGTVFQPRNATTKFCSADCRDASMRTLPKKICQNPSCGKEFQAKFYAERQYCGAECMYEHRRATMPIFHNVCEVCGCEFTSKVRPATACSFTCHDRRKKLSTGWAPQSLRPWVFDHFIAMPVNEARPIKLTPERFDQIAA